MVFRAIPANSRWAGLFFCLAIGLFDLLLLLILLLRPIDWTKFVLSVLLLGTLPLLIHLIYRTWSLFSLEYWVDRNAVTISWAGIRQAIPLYRIERIIYGKVTDLGQPTLWHWPASHLRNGQTLSMKALRLYATRPLNECILLELEESVIALSPEEGERFIEIVQERYALGPAIDVSDVQRPDSLIQRGWHALAELDIVSVSLLFIGIVGVIILFGTLMIRFPNLPGDLVMRYNAEGLPEMIRNKAWLFLLPTIGLMSWMINGIWGGWMASRDQMVGAYMLWGGAVIVQAVSLLALIALMP
ncbi:MAG: PH domain-containing protein [Chloroflexota bacterium]